MKMNQREYEVDGDGVDDYTKHIKIKQMNYEVDEHDEEDEEEKKTQKMNKM